MEEEHSLTPAVENDPTWSCEVGDYGTLGCTNYLVLLPDIAQAAEDAELPRLELTIEPLGTGPRFAGLGASLDPDAPTVESLTFDCEPATATDDAYTIAIDGDPIDLPQWERLDKDAAPTVVPVKLTRVISDNEEESVVATGGAKVFLCGSTPATPEAKATRRRSTMPSPWRRRWTNF